MNPQRPRSNPGRLRPALVRLDQRNQAVIGFGLGHVPFYALFANVEVDLAWSSTDIAKVSVGHLSGAVHNTAHYRNLHAHKVTGPGLNAVCGELQLEKRAAAARACDIFSLGDPSAGSLQDVEAKPHRVLILG